jgi:uncharacterized protein YjbI with pentapeptide repeats
MTRRRLIVVALGVVLLVAVALGIFWFGWDWKGLIGWKALVDYIDPKNATGRKDAVQVYALMVAGGVAAITAAVGLANLRLTRKNLEQQRELEEQRAEQQRQLTQGTALQAYYEQIGNLITDKDSNLRNTQREEIRELARGQTLTVLQEVDGNGKGSLLTFLYGARLIGTENPAVVLHGAKLQDADLQDANLQGAYLLGAVLQRAKLQDAKLQGAYLQGAELQRADLRAADLRAADLRGASLQGAKLQDAKLQDAKLRDANLQQVEGLTQEQLEQAVGDEFTVLPEYLSVPAWWGS